MAEWEYDPSWANYLTNVGIVPPSNPLGLRSVIKAIIGALSGGTIVANSITAASNAGTIPVTGSSVVNFTNNSAAAMTITLATAGASDGQIKTVRVYDFSGAAETITWVNTENSTVSVPTTSNGSTTLPLSVVFQYNAATSHWRCILKA